VFTVQVGDLLLDGVDDLGVAWAVADNGVDGWGVTASTVSQTQKPRASGAWSGSKFGKGRAVTVAGMIDAPTPEAAQGALDRLGTAISREEFPLRVTEAASTRWAPVYQTGEIIPKWLNGLQVAWSFQVASDDWRKFGDELAATTGLPSEAGGLAVPLSIPFSVDAVSASGQVSLVNPGNESGPVTLRIDGPCTGPAITHTSTGNALVFASSLVLGAGEFLIVDMEARTVLANGQVSRSGWITSRGWSSFDPGANTWAFTAAQFDPLSRLTVSATPSWK